VLKSRKKPAGAKKAAPSRPAAKKLAAKKPAAARKGAAPRKAKAPGARKPPLKSKRPAVRAKRPAKKPGHAAAATLQVKENREGLALARAIAFAALEKKALDVVVIDTRARGPLVGYDYVVLASGESDRQLDAIAQAVEDQAALQGRKPTGVESSPDWVLCNFDDVVAHFFTPDKRGTYDLEGLWSDAPRVPLT
jgi:ribosome-associated protein